MGVSATGCGRKGESSERRENRVFQGDIDEKRKHSDGSMKFLSEKKKNICLKHTHAHAEDDQRPIVCRDSR